ncbi:uncharacterized protein LOC129596554 [Paramacrobiotus metropolitanus]|uniref:uncharacterized protein LOC129596554 n=1 Tax=Paramacrobiotus metropolitanus TaxID=2943436 RepID=UPI0024465417|nr:uncharacterized protein LOC129596554 [Paramacrobiotus metropolitanus]
MRDIDDGGVEQRIRWMRTVILLLLVITMFPLCYGFTNLKLGQIPVVETRSLSNFTILDSALPFKVFVQLDPKTTQPTMDVAVLNRTLLDQITWSVDTVKGVLRLSYNPSAAPTDNLQGFFGNIGGLTGNSAFSIFGSGQVTINGVTVTGGNGAPSMSGKEAEVTIRTSALTAILADGSGDIEVQSPVVVAGTLTLSVTGSGSMGLPSVTADTLQASITGSGTVKIAGGKVNTASISAHGTGSFDGERLQVGSANALASGMGNIAVSVSENLVGSLAGMGGIKYHGTPKVNVQTSGLAQVTKLDTA